MSWLPVDSAAKSLVEIVFSHSPSRGYTYNLENPVPRPMSGLGAFVVHELRLADKLIPCDEWLDWVSKTGYATNLLDFFRNDFQAVRRHPGHEGCERKVDTPACKWSNQQDLIVEYIERWKDVSLLS